ncbi:MAG TPA: hypothetical protein VK206_17700, partial [Anaerolineales bacterium]|nr:hypothetical protein [Anaerolineales bacterium]
MTRRILFLISLIFAVIAVIFVIPPILHTRHPAPLTLSSQPDLVPKPEKAVAAKLIPSDGTMLLAITEKETGVGLQARPVDPTTLTDLPGYTEIDFGHHYTYAVSPDRKLLAIITWPSGWGAGGRLHLIELERWIDRLTDLQIDDYVSDLTFSADGKTLYWTKPTVHDPAHGMPRAYQLYGYDLEDQQLSVIDQLPSSFMPWSQSLSSGKLVIFGIPTDSDNLTEDAPCLLFIDPTEKRIVSGKRIDGV